MWCRSGCETFRHVEFSYIGIFSWKTTQNFTYTSTLTQYTQINIEKNINIPVKDHLGKPMKLEVFYCFLVSAHACVQLINQR